MTTRAQRLDSEQSRIRRDMELLAGDNWNPELHDFDQMVERARSGARKLTGEDVDHYLDGAARRIAVAFGQPESMVRSFLEVVAP